MNTPTDPLEELISQFRNDIMLAAQGISSDNETYRESATNVAALSTINFKDKLKALIHTREQQAREDELNLIEKAQQDYDRWSGFCMDDTSDFGDYINSRLATLNKEEK